MRRVAVLKMAVVCCVAIACAVCPPAGAQPAGAPGSQAPVKESSPLGRIAPAGDSPASRGGFAPTSSGGWSIVQTAVSLSLVIAIIVVLALVVRQVARSSGGLAAALGAGGRAPSGLLEVLGRYPIGRGVTLVVLKFDRRVLLVQQSAGRGLRGQVTMSTLCEVVEPEDVASILIKTRDDEGESMARRFQSVLSKEDRAMAEAIEPQPVTIRPALPAAPTARPHPAARPATTRRTPAPSEAVAAIRSRLQSLRGGRTGGRAG